MTKTVLFALVLFLSAVPQGTTAPILNGVTYNPLRADKSCATKELIDQDLGIISTYTNRIRTYAVGCEGKFGHDLPMLQAAVHYNISVYIGLWVDRWNETWTSQLSILTNLLANATETELGRIEAIIVGNEAMFRGEQTPKQIIEKIQIVKDLTSQHPALAGVQFTTSDITPFYTDPELIATVDFLLPNIHVFFDNFQPEDAPGYLWVRYEKLKSQVGGKRVVIGETGWPSAGKPWGTSTPSPAAAEFLLNAIQCEAAARGAEYFYFDAFNADWKRLHNEHDSEFYWGLSLSNRSAFKSYVLAAFNCTPASYLWKRIPVCNFDPYDSKLYTCTDGTKLCTAPNVACGPFGEFACYDTSKAECVNGTLRSTAAPTCPAPLLPCGEACYDPKNYQCNNGVLGPRQAAPTPDAPAPSTTPDAPSTTPDAPSTTPDAPSTTPDAPAPSTLAPQPTTLVPSSPSSPSSELKADTPFPVAAVVVPIVVVIVIIIVAVVIFNKSKKSELSYNLL